MEEDLKNVGDTAAEEINEIAAEDPVKESEETLTAEDAVQETFVKVYRGLNGFHGQSSIKTWIMKIAIHTCYDMNHSGWFRHFDRRITPEMLPEAAVPFEERDEELITAVMRLPIKLREVILLFYYQGFSSLLMQCSNLLRRL